METEVQKDKVFNFFKSNRKSTKFTSRHLKEMLKISVFLFGLLQLLFLFMMINDLCQLEGKNDAPSKNKSNLAFLKIDDLRDSEKYEQIKNLLIAGSIKDTHNIMYGINNIKKENISNTDKEKIITLLSNYRNNNLDVFYNTYDYMYLQHKNYQYSSIPFYLMDKYVYSSRETDYKIDKKRNDDAFEMIQKKLNNEKN